MTTGSTASQGVILDLNPCVDVGSATAAGNAQYNAQQGTLNTQVHGATTYSNQPLKVYADGNEMGTLLVTNGGSGSIRATPFGPPTLVEVKDPAGILLFSTGC